MVSTINLTSLKRLATDGGKDFPVTRRLILLEPEAIPYEEFLAKLKLWLLISRMEKENMSGQFR